MPNLKSAYTRARRAPTPSYAMQGARVPAWRGVSYAEPDDGIGAAAYALSTARRNVAAYGDARAHYESTHATRDTARLESNDAKRRAESLARDGGPAYESAAQNVTERVAALSIAERFADKARADVARLRALCTAPGDSYVGTWQGGAGHMTPGGKGGQFFADDDSGVIRNARDAHEIARLGHAGYYDNPHGESFRDGAGLILGVVGQLRGRDGRAVFVPGWRMGDNGQGGTQYDMRARFVAEGREESDESAAEECARYADGMAETVAESERGYHAAWGAGQAWADAGERLGAIRAGVLAILSERRAARGMGQALPALCDAIRARVDSLLSERAELMAERAELADGDSGSFCFYPDANARAAFCEGAGLQAMPA